MSRYWNVAGLALFYGVPALAEDTGRNWTGVYLGGNLGYGLGKDTQSGNWIYPTTPPVGAASFSFTQLSRGTIGGGQVGFNYQIAPFAVLGVEADIQGSDMSSSSTGNGVGNAVNAFSQNVSAITQQKLFWMGTVRGRIGVIPPDSNFMIYATGGLAYGKVKSTATLVSRFPAFPAVASGTDSFTASRTGWTVGGGVEYALSTNWTIKAEYLFTDLGSMSTSGRAQQQTSVGELFNFSRSAAMQFHTVRVGFNYSF